MQTCFIQGTSRQRKLGFQFLTSDQAFAAWKPSSLFPYNLLVRFKTDPLAAFSFRAQRGSDSKIALNRGMGAQQKCCAPTAQSWNWLKQWPPRPHPSSLPVTNLATCFASIKSWGLCELNGVRIISVGAPERISWKIKPTNFTTCFCFAVHHGAQIRDPITDREFRSHVHVVRTHVRLQRGCL